MIVWVDDLALPIPCLLASELDNTVQDSLLRVQLVFKKFGLQLNFNPGKTEANLHYCGSGAPDLRRQRFVEGHGILPISHHEDLRIVSQFSHLGIVLAQNCNMDRDIQHRLGKAASAYRSMSRQLFHNRKLAIEAIGNEKIIPGRSIFSPSPRKNHHFFGWSVDHSQENGW